MTVQTFHGESEVASCYRLPDSKTLVNLIHEVDTTANNSQLLTLISILPYVLMQE